MTDQQIEIVTWEKIIGHSVSKGLLKVLYNSLSVMLSNFLAKMLGYMLTKHIQSPTAPNNLGIGLKMKFCKKLALSIFCLNK